MRVTILDEFVGVAGKDERLLQRVITAFGDDSVQQLTGIHVVVENASNLLTKKLEWGRLASYLEQSTRYIYYDQKDKKGHYRYFIPRQLTPEIKNQYRLGMDELFDIYSTVVHKLTDYLTTRDTTPTTERDGAWRSAIRAQACDAARPLLPVATTSTVGIFASGQALENLIMHLQSDELQEAQKVGRQLLREARKVIPTFLERADKPDRGGATIAYRANTYTAMQKIAQDYLPQHYSEGRIPVVDLVDVWPRNELDLVADMLYEHSDLSLRTLRNS
jgi:thymidylate synthase ThyX